MFFTTSPLTSVSRESRRIAIGEFLVIKAEEVEEGGVEVMDMHGVLDVAIAKFVRRAINGSAFHAAAARP